METSSNKKTIILGSSVAILIILIIIFSLIKTTPDTSTRKVTDESKFFSINNLMNEDIQEESPMSNYYSTSIYYKEFENYNIYFITGFLVDNSIESTYTNNVNYVLKTRGATYTLNKLNGITNMKEYANNYTEDTEEYNSSKMIPPYRYSEEAKLIYYMSTLNTLLNENPEEAYNYFSETQKEKYNGFDDFKYQLFTIEPVISTYIKNYSSKQKKDEKIYTITTKGLTKITLYEKNVMDFTIEY